MASGQFAYQRWRSWYTTGVFALSSSLSVISGECRGLVTLQWSRVRVVLSRGDLCCLDGRSMSAARRLASQSRRSCRSEHKSMPAVFLALFVSISRAGQRAITRWMTYCQEPFLRQIFLLPRNLPVFFAQMANVPTAWLSSHGAGGPASQSFGMWQWSAPAPILMWRLRLAKQTLQLS